MAGRFAFPNIEVDEGEDELYELPEYIEVDDEEGEDAEDDDDEYDGEGSSSEEEEEYNGEDEEYRGVGGDDVGPPQVELSSRDSPAERPLTSSQEAVIEENVAGERRGGAGETSSSQGGTAGTARGERCKSEADVCPICMDVYYNGGDHQICCLPCGHLYGKSCIMRWLKQHKNFSKCPQCNKKCTLQDVRIIYGQAVVVDQELLKKVRSLEAKCAYLEKKDSDWHKKEIEWQRREADLKMQVHQLKEGCHGELRFTECAFWLCSSCDGICQM